MPNHVANVIKMEGIKNLPLFSVDDDGKQYFDFSKLIPMPESLNVESGSSTNESIVYFLAEKCTIPIGCLEDGKKEMLKKVVDNMFCQGELAWAKELFQRVMQRMYGETEYRKNKLYENGKTYISNYQNYGYTTWYDWCCNNWGTKWNAYSFELWNDDTIKFDTAWSCPEPVIQKLAEMYPKAIIEHWWADEGCGSNSGYKTYENGEVNGDYDDSGSSSAYEHYNYCWGGSKCIYQDDDGNYCKHDCETCHGCD